jgi:pimeloyl-ACP methyl ester carboxylesterase
MRRRVAVSILTFLIMVGSASVPVLGIYAERSALARDGMKRLYSNLAYHEVPGTGHFLMMEKPQEFNRLVGSFLSKVNF